MAQVSVVKMFIAGFLPGILGGLGLAGVSYLYALKYDFPVEQRFRWSQLVKAFREAAWALLLPVIILGGIFGGFVTATEGAALRSEEHTSELQSLMRISYAVFCLKKKKAEPH